MRSIRCAFILLSIMLLQSTDGFCQVFLERQVIGSTGFSSVAFGNSFSGTAGQAINSTDSAGNYILTQGFHQPLIQRDIYFQIETTFASCATSTDGSAQLMRITGCDGPYRITWSNGGQGFNQDRLAPGSYTVTVETQTCSVTRELSIQVDPESDCLIRFFKAFSPNGDGVNDVWKVENIFRPEFTQNNIEIFNRWGQPVWKGDGYDNANVAFAGLTSNGSTLPDGTYFFVANIANVVHKGFLEITR